MDAKRNPFSEEDLSFIDRALALRSDRLGQMALEAKEPGAAAALSRGAARHLQLRELIKAELSMSGAGMIQAERARQTTAEGYTERHDAEHEQGELGWAAAHYAAPGPAVHEENGEPIWPFGGAYDKKQKHDRIRQLTIAGAFCAAEIDRLKRAETKE